MNECLKCIFGNKEPKSRDKREKIRKSIQSTDMTPPISPFKTDKKSVESEITRLFTSPKGVTGNDIDKHIIRLRERGYEVISMIGSGSFGKCYDVKKSSDGTKFAVKILYLGEFDKDDRLFQDFTNEVWILKEAPHNNIIKLVDHFMYDRCYTYTVLEFADKGTLDEKLKSLGKPLNENQAKLYFFQISRAIDHLHRMGIAHRDIKLSNVLICSLPNGKQVIKVADFGLSRVSYKSEYGTVMTNKPVGTIYYMSPQILSLYVCLYNKSVNIGGGHRTDPFKADVWALGVCLYFMLVRKYPFEDTTQLKIVLNQNERQMKANLAERIYTKQMKRKPILPKHIASEVSKECHYLLMDTLEVDKEKRIQMSGIVRNMWFDEWLDSENVSEINSIHLMKFIDKYNY